MKKDPLQRDPTAYELLGVEPGAGGEELPGAAEVDAAGSGETIAAARELGDPVRRALVDLFLYQDRYLDDLAFDDPFETLNEVRRRAAERWRAIEKRGFPLAGATHSIAVLSYWEARGSRRNDPGLPNPPDVTARLWEAALSRFAALSASEAFWAEWGVVTGNRVEGEAAANALEQRITDEFEAMAWLRRENGDVPGEGRVREHLALFRSELEAARALAELKVLSGRGLSPTAITAGPYLLAEVGLLDKVRAVVEERRPALLPLFSPFAVIERLVAEREYASALGALERLDAGSRASSEARRIEAGLWLGLALKDLQADRVDDAFGHWERALACAEARAPVAIPLSESVLGKAKLLQSREAHDDAIALLQRALPLGEREILRVPLAHFLFERAEMRIARATVAAGDEEADLGPAIAEMRGAVADLEEAVAIDLANGEIRERRNEVEDLLRVLLARTGPESATVVETAVEEEATDASSGEPSPATGAPSPAAKRSSALMAVGIALWVGIGLLALVAYPLIMPHHLGGAGTIISVGVAVGWIATNAIGWVLLR
jgi:tetratricopeptide (TPR) repeat protein